MKPTTGEKESTQEPQWKLWHALTALGGLSVVFAVLVALDLAAVIGLILGGLVFLGIQALLLIWVMRRLRQQAAREREDS